MPKVLVLNPNSNSEVTGNIDTSLNAIRETLKVDIDVTNLENTPYGIESQEDVESVAMPILKHLMQQEANYDAFIIACFSDPGLASAKEQISRPVTGIAESGLLTALTLGDRIGIISISSSSIARHHRYYRALGINSRIAGDVAINSSVADLADEHKTTDNILKAANILKETYGANALVLGCAGMPFYRKPIQETLNIPVVDPTQAATLMAINQVILDSR